jgi:Mg2+ and Co2+ transporter CorA
VRSEGKTDQTVKGFLFEENGEDRAIDPAELDDQELNDQQLLWVDIDTSAEGATDAIPRSIAFEQTLADAIGDGEHVPLVRDFEDRFRVRLLLPVQSEGEPDTLDCVVGANWVVTAHPGELDLLDRFMEPLEGERQTSVAWPLHGSSHSSSTRSWTAITHESRTWSGASIVSTNG